ncbi:MAG TPA: cytochrome c [Usitatibacteraceae bacterium]
MRTGIFLLAVSTSMAFTASTQAAEPGNAPSAERGQALYQKNMCFTCHGTVGNGGERTSGPRLAPNVWPVEAMKVQLRSPRQDMPRYGEKFVSDADLADIHAYLSSIKAGPKAKDIPLLANM